MRILFVVEYYFPSVGGVQVVVREIAEGSVKLGHEVDIVTCKLAGTKSYEEINGVRVHRVSVPKRGDRYWFNTLWAIPKVLEVGRRCDVIHAACYNSAFPAWIVAKFLRKKKIITVHEPLGAVWRSLSDMSYSSAKLHQVAERILLSLPFDRCICVSRSTEKRLRSINKLAKDEKLIVVYNGLDNEIFDASKADGSKIRKKLKLGDEFVYMFFGRPGISKGVEYLISAVPLIATQIPDSRLLLILARNPENRYGVLTKMIQNLKIENKAILLDPVPRKELPNYIAASDCVVVPSLSEGFGFTAAEACAMGKPVVASNVASLPEVVSGKYVLVEPKNPEAIADGVEKVYNGQAENSNKKFFSWDECIEEYLETYRKILVGKYINAKKRHNTKIE